MRGTSSHGFGQIGTTCSGSDAPLAGPATVIFPGPGPSYLASHPNNDTTQRNDATPCCTAKETTAQLLMCDCLDPPLSSLSCRVAPLPNPDGGIWSCRSVLVCFGQRGSSPLPCLPFATWALAPFSLDIGCRTHTRMHKHLHCRVIASLLRSDPPSPEVCRSLVRGMLPAVDR
jgi:hypothetical protein